VNQIFATHPLSSLDTTTPSTAVGAISTLPHQQEAQTTAAMSTSTAMDMPMSTAMSTMEMPASQMQMVFFTSRTTPLLSAAWSPATTGQYAGTCIFLVALAVAFRALLAFKSVQERRWAARVRRRPAAAAAVEKRRDVAAVTSVDDDAAERKEARAGLVSRATSASASSSSSTGHAGAAHRQPPSQDRLAPIQPWRLSVDLPRACLVLVLVGVGYLL